MASPSQTSGNSSEFSLLNAEIKPVINGPRMQATNETKHDQVEQNSSKLSTFNQLDNALIQGHVSVS
ncbi:hypothetical protein CCACVL1_19245 [Corchorus capsularis]|uniref:Uncharacterized protein n=1 Tax=Corchorus capsularis TaxID=210143 RepID=A0A1R3HHH3_COCAP|nr:hypothetical protein CCACVL1_19245 [Corchorus capsularis]